MDKIFDLFIIGGGINGCGCAADASLRGLSVMLCDKGDLASQTSSKSTKLIHGGLRYLEHYQFSLVRKALKERQILFKIAPHLVKPLELMMPYHQEMRAPWLIRSGLFIYDYITLKNELPKSHGVNRKRNPTYFTDLKDHFTKGFVFHDGSTKDARLSICNAIQAKENGAVIANYTEMLHGEVVDGVWQILLKNTLSGQTYTVLATCIINATGPWLNLVNQRLNIPVSKTLTLVKGSHIVVPRLYEGSHAYFLQSDDKRVIFVIPYYGCTMIGTTDQAFNEDLDTVEISNDEISYLCRITNQYFKYNLCEKEVINSWSGVRPLISEENAPLQELSRDYFIEQRNHPAPIINIYGGKITTYRKLAEDVINHTKVIFKTLKPAKTDKTMLPGATCQDMSFEQYKVYALAKYNFLKRDLLDYYLDNYACSTEFILNECQCMADLGQHFGYFLYQNEVNYLRVYEWAKTAEDILWRRSKQGLHISPEATEALDNYMSTNL